MISIIRWVILLWLGAASGVLPLWGASLVAGFVEEDVGSGWNEAVGMVFGKNGDGTKDRIYVWERTGRVWIVEDGVKLASPLLDLREEVGGWRDHGLLGFALDPHFAANGHVYLLYVVDRHHLMKFGTSQYSATANEYFAATIGRLTRYTARRSDDFRTVDPASRRVLIGETKSTGFPILHSSHGVGSLVFGSDGTLLATCGDGASYEAMDNGGTAGNSYGPQAVADGIITPAENIGAFRCQLLDSLSGKIVRIDPLTGDGVPSNPYFTQGAPRSARSRVWARGLRNPMRMTLKPHTGSHLAAEENPGVLMIGDVGWNSAEDMEVAERPGLNFGWPLYEGYNQVASYWNARPAGMDAADWVKPKCSWRSNAFVLTPAGTAQRFGAAGTVVPGPNFNGNCSIGGVWYTGSDFPAEWQNVYFHADYGAKWIRAFTMDANHFVTSQRWFLTDGSITCLATHPEQGGLYYVNWGGGLKRLRYVPSGNLSPTAVATASKTSGVSPLSVQFSSLGSLDPEGGALTYQWDFGDGTTSTEPHPAKTYTSTGPQAFTATLTVRDPSHATAHSSVLVTVNNPAPAVEITSPPNDFTFPVTGTAVNIPLTAKVTAPGHDPANLNYRWQVFLHHNRHSHAEPEQTTPTGNVVLSPLAPNATDYYYYKVVLTVTDPLGAVGKAQRIILPASSSTGVPPFVAMDDPPSVVSEAFFVALTFNESVSGLQPEDFEITNGVATALEGAGAHYILTVAALASGPLTIELPAGRCHDAEGLPNGASLPVRTFFLAPPPPPPTAPGLHAEYYEGENFAALALTRTEQRIGFYWPGSVSPAPSVPGDYFSARWKGRIIVPSSGVWKILADVDDGIRIWIDDQLVMNHWEVPPAFYWGVGSSPITLQAGVAYDLRVDYRDFFSDAYLNLSWTGPNRPLETIPASAFSLPGDLLDSSPPRVTLSAPSAANNAFSVVVSFNESIDGLSVNDFILSNASASGLTGDGITYQVTITPVDPGLVSVRLPAGAVADAAGNPSLPSNELVVDYTPSPPVGEAGLKAEYFIGENFGLLALTRTDALPEFYWPGSMSAAPGLPGDYFSARWTGRLTPPATGSWQFFVDVDDGVRLWVNGQMVLDHWNRPPAVYWGLSSLPIALQAGVPVDIRLEYQDFYSDAYLILRWSGPSTSQQPVPAGMFSQPLDGPDLVAPSVMLSAPVSVTGPFSLTAHFSEPVVGLTATDFAVVNGSASGLTGSGSSHTVSITPHAIGPITVRLPAGAAFDGAGHASLASNELEIHYAAPPPSETPGIRGEYFTGSNFDALVLQRIDPRVEYYWPETFSPAPGMAGDYFSIRWTGQLTAPTTGAWQFFADVDDGLRLWVDGQLVLHHWNPQPAVYWGLASTPVDLTAGSPVSLRIDYQDFFSDAYLVLRWAGPGVPMERIPASAYSLGSADGQGATGSHTIDAQTSGQRTSAGLRHSGSIGFEAAQADWPRVESSLAVVPDSEGNHELIFQRPRFGRLAIVLQSSWDMVTWQDVPDPGWPTTALPDGLEAVRVAEISGPLRTLGPIRFFRLRQGP